MNIHSPLRATTAISRPWSEDDLALYEAYYAAEARENFWAFRRFMDPALRIGWFPRDVSNEFQLFYDRLIRGERPKLVLMAPPQHGKSRNLEDFLAWVAGKQPELRQIFASYSDNLGTRTNNALQRMLDNPKYHLAFPKTRINGSNVVTMTGAKRNSSQLDFIGYRGSFQNVTVEGQVTGKSLDLGVIDDPIKGRDEASSKAMRDKKWNWFLDDFFTRFDDKAGLIITMTRWHVDDPVGRFLEKFPDAIVLKYPAIATRDGQYRRKGEALFPEFKSMSFLMERKSVMTESSWESLYQQSPFIGGGSMFPVEKLAYVDAMVDRRRIVKSVRYWDKAGTTDGGAFTAGVLMHLLDDGRVLIENVVRGQWNAFDRERMIMQTAESDATRGTVHIWIEQEPGSGGKESAERTINMLKGHRIYKDRVTGSKQDRAEPYAAQWQGGQVIALRSKWNLALVEEHESFPHGKRKDQVDAAAGAFIKLSEKGGYDTSMGWVD